MIQQQLLVELMHITYLGRVLANKDSSDMTSQVDLDLRPRAADGGVGTPTCYRIRDPFWEC